MSRDSINQTANIGDGTTTGFHCVIGSGVIIGENCQIGHHVVIHDDSRIGDGVRIDDHAVIGKRPMRAAASATTSSDELEPASVGPGAIIGTGAIIYRGADLGARVLVADLATVREKVTVGERTIIGRGVAIENSCTIGSNCKLETNAYITAFSVLEDNVFVAPGVLTSNDNFLGRTQERFKHFKGVTVRKGGRLGVGSVVLPGKEIGADAVVAAGAVLTRNADGETIYAGVPATRFRDVPDEQKLGDEG
ncbi:MAG: N-acetyltransferase [Rhodothermales bacterium]|nr:N-acetyltransferase [Rhodothermales bacterium]